MASVAAHFPGFRDHAVYKGQQLTFFKRAQILVGDVWGAFGGQGLGRFDDIDELTCFADYRLPQLLNSLGIMVFILMLPHHSHNSLGFYPNLNTKPHNPINRS